MDLRKFKKFGAVLIAAALAASAGCADTAGESQGEDYVEGTLAGTELGASYAADDVFSLNSRAEDGFNPYTTVNSDNRLVGQLVYENIFEVDNDFSLSSRIVTDWKCVDGTYWYFTVDTGIVMHDGENLTAKDVSYSLQQAIRTSRYSGRPAAGN
ncbi:MAG TPA: hypothetical protein DC001_01075, partial [Clostridiales bacterium]|nr:hypothetical protein [Clostridiales bacterium]